MKTDVSCHTTWLPLPLCNQSLPSIPYYGSFCVTMPSHYAYSIQLSDLHTLFVPPCMAPLTSLLQGSSHVQGLKWCHPQGPVQFVTCYSLYKFQAPHHVIAKSASSAIRHLDLDGLATSYYCSFPGLLLSTIANH